MLRNCVKIDGRSAQGGRPLSDRAATVPDAIKAERSIGVFLPFFAQARTPSLE